MRKKDFESVGREVVGGADVEKLTVVKLDVAEYGAAQARGALDNRLKHRFGVSRRLAHHIEDLTRRCLIIERLRQLRGPRLHRLEQPHILDRDHCLVGKGRGQLDVLLSERPDCAANERDHADRHAFSQERHAELRAEFAQPRDIHQIFGVFKCIVNMDNASLE